MAESTNAQEKVDETARAGAETGDAQEKEESKEPEMTPEQQALIDKRVQSEADKIRTKYVKELKAERDALETLKKEKMSAEEKVQYETKKAAEALEGERRQVTAAKLELYAIKALSSNDLGTELIPFVMADSEEAVDEKIKSLKSYLFKHRKIVSDEITKGNGRTVQQTSMSAQGLYSLEQLKAFSQSQIDAIMATPEGEKRIKDSYATAVRK